MLGKIIFFLLSVLLVVVGAKELTDCQKLC